MHKIVFECETITPMFLSGADGSTPELRPPSIKGALRFWWRAMNGHLGLEELKKLEGEIFGGTGKKASRSSFSIRVNSIQEPKTAYNEMLVPHKSFMRQNAIDRRQNFQVELLFRGKSQSEYLKALFILTSLLGGVGKRVRRGMGSFTVKKIQIDGSSDESFTSMPNNCKEILKYLNVIAPQRFGLKDNKLVSVFKSSVKYPYIKQIEIGRKDSRILYKISNTTHQINERNKRSYPASLGNTNRGRFASPIFVSVIDKDTPIITTLNTAPKKDLHLVSTQVQEDFRKAIL